MKKKIVSTIAGAVVLSSVAVALPQNPVTTPHVQNEASAKALSTITLSKSETKQMSKRMKEISGSKSATVIEAIIGTKGGPIGGAAALASALARNSVDKDIFHQAANQNKRIQIEVHPGATPNLKEFKYKIV